MLEFTRKYRINFIFGVPTHAQVLINLSKEGERLLPDLKAFHTGTTMIPEPLRQQIQEYLTPNLHIAYGTSENGILTVAPPVLIGKIPGVVGYMIPDATVEVIDDDDNPLPSGHVGKLRIKSAGMIDGYLDDPEETARAFGDGWFYPGDLGELTPDGALIHYGRADDMMIFNGMNIYPAEIENALLQHPAIHETAAFAIGHPVSGDLPVAAIVTKAPVSDDALRVHCQVWLGAKSPSHFMRVRELPRNALGKVLKRQLVERSSALRHRGPPRRRPGR